MPNFKPDLFKIKNNFWYTTIETKNHLDDEYHKIFFSLLDRFFIHIEQLMLMKFS